MSEEDTHILYDPVQRMICVFCHARMDVSAIAPFTKAVCPSCNNEVTVPARLGAFLLTELLGTGGMGGVYRAHDETLGRDVAIKVMLKSLGDNPEFVASFRREAQAAAKLNHPNIAQIYSFGQERGQPYIVMELVPGLHLDQMIAAPDPLDIPLVMKIGLDIADGLQLAAAANLIHGDIKPENILLDERNQAKLVDFGIAAKPSKSENEIWGTPYYIAPERVRRQRVDFRSDIYCLGGTLYHAITQHPPFEGADALEVVRARLKGPPVPLEMFRPDVAPEVSAIIMRMLQMEPAMRYPTYGSLLSDMRAYLSRVQPKTPVAPSGKRIMIKGRKGSTTIAGGSTTSALSQTAASTTGHLQTTGRQPLVITRGMFPEGTVPPSETAADTPSATKTLPKKGCLIAAITVVTLLLAGVGGSWLLLRHQAGKLANNLAAQQAEQARWTQAAGIAHASLSTAEVSLRGLAAEAEALVTQAVTSVEAVIGTDWTPRILWDDPEPEPEAEAEPEPAADAVPDVVADGATNAPPAEADTDDTTHAPPAEAEADADDATNAPPAEAEADAPETDPEPEPEAEPLPPLAQLARDVHLETLPLRRAVRQAHETVERGEAIWLELQAGSNTTETIREAVGRLQSLQAPLQAAANAAPGIVAATRQKLERVADELRRLTAEREREEAEARRLAAAREAAEAEEARQSAERAAVLGEINQVAETVTAQREALLRHDYKDVLRDLRRLEADLKRAEGKEALRLAVKRVTGLQDLRTFLIRRLNEKPFKSFDGWRVARADERTLTIQATSGRKTDVAWDHVGIRQMAEFIKFYIEDEQEARALLLRERFAQTLNAAIYCVTFGDSEAARAMAATLLSKAVTMMPSERDASLRLLPEITVEP